MAENKMAEVAKVLGVELGEEFQVKYKDTIVYGTFRFTKEGIETKGDGGWKSGRPTLLRLLTGEYEIVKLPWKPKSSEGYYTYAGKGFWVQRYTWQGDAVEHAIHKGGMVFRTEAEAIAARPRICKELTGKEWTE